MNYKEITENLRAGNGDIVELYAEFEKQLKVETPPSVVRTSLLKEFGTKAKERGIPGGWAQLRVLASDLTVPDCQYVVSVDPDFGEEALASVAATVEVTAPVRKKTKKVKKKIKQRAPKPVSDTKTLTEVTFTGEIQQESSQEILSESEEESGGELDVVDLEEDDSELDLGDVPEGESDGGEETEEPDIFS
jgi:hypothetical protein